MRSSPTSTSDPAGRPASLQWPRRRWYSRRPASEARPAVDKLDSDVLPRERRWPLFVVALVVLVGAGLFAMRIGPTGSRSLRLLVPDRRQQRLHRQMVPSAIEAGQGVINPEDARPVSQVSGSQPTAAPGAASADAQAKPTAAGQEPEVNPGWHLVRRRTGRPTAARTTATPGSATPGTAGERCRKVDAGGKGRPTAVLAACRPAIEAEPEAADIMVILAERSWTAGARLRRGLGRRRRWGSIPIWRMRMSSWAGPNRSWETQPRPRPRTRNIWSLRPAGRHARELRVGSGQPVAAGGAERSWHVGSGHRNVLR